MIDATTPPPASTLAEIRAAIQELKAVRPDHLAATHPQAPRHLREAWGIYCNRMEHLRSEEEKAERAERSSWKDVAGQPAEEPINWTEGKGSFINLRSHQPKHSNGRPRTASPSKETLQRRAQRARMRELQGGAA